MSGYYELWLEEQERAADVEHAEWLRTPKGQAWRAEHEKLRAAIEWSNIKHEKDQMAAERARLERERHWQADNPVEWSAWKRLQVVLEQDFLFDFSNSPRYDFEAFLAEVKPAPDGSTHVEQKDVKVAFRPGNLRWAAGQKDEESTPAEPEYLTLKEIARRSGFGYDFVYHAVRRHDLRGVQKGRHWRVKPADFRAWMDRSRAANVAPSQPQLQQTVNRHFPKRVH